MTGDKGQATGSGNKNSYEETVLHFLDKEMSAVSKPQKPTENGAELDDLVSDLLNQVIHEANQNEPTPKVEVETFADLIAEFGPQQEPAPPPGKPNLASKTDPMPGKTENSAPIHERGGSESAATTTVKPSIAESAGEIKLPGQTQAIFASPAANKRKTSMMAMSFIGLLVLVGVSIYLYVGSASHTSEPIAEQSAAANSVASPTKDAPPQPAGQPAVSKEQSPVVSPASRNRPASADTSKRASVVQNEGEKTPSAKPTQTAAATDTSIAPQPKVETPALVIAPPQAVPENKTVSEKQVPPPASESAAVQSTVAEIKSQSIAPNVVISSGISAPEPLSKTAAEPKNTVQAVPISRANPRYPELALRTKASASVVLEVTIDSQGKVTKAVPVSGPTVFHDEAISAAKKWRYKPASINGTNVPSQSKITFNFNLK
jgi:periplasmic protein TonB